MHWTNNQIIPGKKNGIICRKREKRPTVSDQHVETQQSRLNDISQQVFSPLQNKIYLIDDKTYLTLDGNEWQGASYYTSKNGTETVSDNVKYIGKTKFPKKLLLWFCISEKPMSKPVFFKGKLVINAKVLRVVPKKGHKAQWQKNKTK